VKFLKQKNISKFSITDQTLFTNQYGRAVIGLSGGLRLPQGTTAQRPQITNDVRYPGSSTDYANGTIRYNTSVNPITGDVIGLEALIKGVWEVVRAPGATSIRKQTLGPGDGFLTDFGPLAEMPVGPTTPSANGPDYNIMVLVENVVQLSDDNYEIDYNYLGSGNAYIIFASPVDLGKSITIYYGLAN